MRNVLTILVLAIIGFTTCYSQYIPVAIDENIALSKTIVEGEVISKTTFRSDIYDYIYTENIVKLFKVIVIKNLNNSILQAGSFIKL